MDDQGVKKGIKPILLIRREWGIVLTFFGYAAGLLIPQRVFDRFGIDGQAHMAIAYWRIPRIQGARV
jgi:nitrate reductase gamma subunit